MDFNNGKNDMAVKNLQIGKNGLTESFISNLKSDFEKVHNVKVSVLRSARGEGKKGKEIVKKISEELLQKLGKKYTARVIGFTINLKKWRRER